MCQNIRSLRSLLKCTCACEVEWLTRAYSRSIAPGPLSGGAINDHGPMTSCVQDQAQAEQHRDLLVPFEDAVQELLGLRHELKAPWPLRRIPVQLRALAQLPQRPHVAVLLPLFHIVVGEDQNTVDEGVRNVHAIWQAHAGRALRHHAHVFRVDAPEAGGLVRGRSGCACPTGRLLLTVLLVRAWHLYPNPAFPTLRFPRPAENHAKPGRNLGFSSDLPKGGGGS